MPHGLRPSGTGARVDGRLRLLHGLRLRLLRGLRRLPLSAGLAGRLREAVPAGLGVRLGARRGEAGRRSRGALLELGVRCGRSGLGGRRTGRPGLRRGRLREAVTTRRGHRRALLREPVAGLRSGRAGRLRSRLCCRLRPGLRSRLCRRLWEAVPRLGRRLPLGTGLCGGLREAVPLLRAGRCGRRRLVPAGGRLLRCRRRRRCLRRLSRLSRVSRLRCLRWLSRLSRLRCLRGLLRGHGLLSRTGGSLLRTRSALRLRGRGRGRHGSAGLRRTGPVSRRRGRGRRRLVGGRQRGQRGTGYRRRHPSRF
ncbi:type II secretion system protein E [Streptomyces griseoaurantiacus M045]|uniref:Type II secretion system protein E n=1 Tax=Streptomyces griseoaurantiacus M045 TaxID=996637 RepID=F3NFE6_9ACTN|nr:type II secretion system protein E [Streptomyces griseoaurantiacus M045]